MDLLLLQCFGVGLAFGSSDLFRLRVSTLCVCFLWWCACGKGTPRGPCVVVFMNSRRCFVGGHSDAVRLLWFIIVAIVQQSRQTRTLKRKRYLYYFNRLTTIPTKWVCAQPRLRSAWASAQSDQSLRCIHEETLGPQLPTEHNAKTLIRLGGCPGWSEFSLGSQSFCWVCHVAANFTVQWNTNHLVKVKQPTRERNRKEPDKVFITCVPRVAYTFTEFFTECQCELMKHCTYKLKYYRRLVLY